MRSRRTDPFTGMPLSAPRAPFRNRRLRRRQPQRDDEDKWGDKGRRTASSASKTDQRVRRREAKRRKEKRKQEKLLLKIVQAKGGVIEYDGPPKSPAERGRRLSEQKAISRLKKKDWSKLSKAEQSRRIRFGSRAHCRRPSDVRDLAKINGRIACTKQREATANWTMTRNKRRKLSSLIGFGRCSGLIVSNKRVQARSSWQLALLLKRLLKRSDLNFYILTITNSRWLTRHNRTHIKLGWIKRTVKRLLERSRLDWLGFIEIDMCNNWPGQGGGLAVMPHVHAIAWGERKIQPQITARELSASKRLKKLFGRPTIDIRHLKSETDVMHAGYYVRKPSHRVKSFRTSNDSQNLDHIYTVETSARPSQILRIAEIESHLTLDDIMVSGGLIGNAIARKLLARLRRWQVANAAGAAKVDDVHKFWNDIRPPRSRNAYPPVTITL